MSQAIVFMVMVPLALLLVLAFNLLKDRMSEMVRKRVELGLILIIYPAFILTWAWQAWDYQQRSDWPGFWLKLALVVLFTIQFVSAARSGVLFPHFRNPAK